jgi:hypothetical protein
MTLTGAVKGTVSVEAELLLTDEHLGYRQVGKICRHETVKHINLEYVRKGDPVRVNKNETPGMKV